MRTGEAADSPVVYNNLEQFKQKILCLKLTGWTRREEEDRVVFEYLCSVYALPKFYVKVHSSLNFSLIVYNWFLPEHHDTYKIYKRSLQFTTLSTLLSTVEGSQICDGLIRSELKEPTPSIVMHTVPLHMQHYEEDGPPFQTHVFMRSANCHMLCNDDPPRPSCTQEQNSLRTVKAPKKATAPLKEKAPLCRASKSHLIATVQHQRLACKQLEERIAELAVA